ncbi:hypothetical protein G3570_01485 [Balneolaceae bacterium YR4-1]|uniref:Lipocalin-like domain-containing protein n=1 Tax=Halalkalibaculum roseum TaxID=2709311 RepID=A0A6M1SR52_9BACT|nr:hypothetical protein [Halalkalibaculum roseum]NGP75290.1 hypothetical protein [Halalkalibaculum roseum]
MKFLSSKLVTTVILLLAVSLTGCDQSVLHTQTDLPASNTVTLIGVWHLIPNSNNTDSEHQLEFTNNILTEVISKSEQNGNCVDEPQLYKEYQWSETQHSNELKLVTTEHMECGSEISVGTEHMVSFRLEDDVLHIFNKRWERAIFDVD